MGWDADEERYGVRTIESQGFARDDTIAVQGRTWKLSCEHERATDRFGEDARTQEISCEWKPIEERLPLCDRTAHRIDQPAPDGTSAALTPAGLGRVLARCQPGDGTKVAH